VKFDPIVTQGIPQTLINTLKNLNQVERLMIINLKQIERLRTEIRTSLAAHTKPSTPNPKTSTLYPIPYILNPERET